MKRLSAVLGSVLLIALVIGGLVFSAVSATQHPHTLMDGNGWWHGYTFTSVDALSGHYFWANAYNGVNQRAQYSLNLLDRATYHPGYEGTCDEHIESGCRTEFDNVMSHDWVGYGPAFFGTRTTYGSISGYIGVVGDWNTNPAGEVGTSGGKARASYTWQQYGSANGWEEQHFPVIKYDYDGMTTKYIVTCNTDQCASENVDFTVTETYLDNTVITATHNVYRYEVAAFDALNSSCDYDSDPDECIGSAVIESELPLLIHLVEFEEGETTPTKAAAYRPIYASDATNPDYNLGRYVYAPTMKNDFWGGDTEAFVYNGGSSSVDVDIDFEVTNDEGACADERGDTASDTITVPGNDMVIVSHAEGNVGDLADCVFYTAVFDGGSGSEIGVVVRETQASGDQISMYNAASYDRLLVRNESSNHTERGMIPTFKEDFVSNRGSITIANFGTGSGKATLTFSNEGPDGDEWEVDTKTLSPGEAVVVSKISDGEPASGWWTEEWTGDDPPDNEMYAVSVDPSGDTGFAFFAIYQEKHLTNALDLRVSEMGSLND